MSAAAARDVTAGAIVLAGPPPSSSHGRAKFDPAWARLAGRPVCAWAVDTLDASPHIGRVALVVERPRLAAARRLISASGWSTVRAAGPIEYAEEQESLGALLAGGLLAILDELAVDAPQAVVLHEGMRPLLSPSLIDALFATWDGVSVVAAASPVKETLKAVDARHRVRQTPQRDRLWQVRTPLLLSGPRLERIIRAEANEGAHAATRSDRIVGLIARTPGVRLRLVPAGHEDVVVHRRADVPLAEGMLAIAQRQ